MINFKRIIRSDQPPATTPESLKIIYAEVTHVIHIYYEWRHKVITWYISAGGAVVVSAQWILEHPEYRDRLWIILLFFAIVSLVLLQMEKVNTSALIQNYELAVALEKKISKSQYFSVYKTALDRYKVFKDSKFTLDCYAAILFWVYLGSAIVSLVFAFCLYPTGTKSPPSPDNKCFCYTEISEKMCR